MVSLTNRLESKVIVVTGGSSGIGVAGLTRAAALQPSTAASPRSSRPG
jgi:NAD(P)-dependent dehydrogenase (short-subunit alcohol dehydrogenase family)